MNVLDRLTADGRVRRNVPLHALTTYKFGGPARWYAEPGDRSELEAVVEAARGAGVPVVVLGRGSNLVIGDRGLEALVVRLTGAFLDLSIGDDGVVSAGGAVPLPRLARATVKAGRTGLEFYVGIPGSVGGAVAMNAGCHGVETADVMIETEILDVRSGALRTSDPAGLDMRYRHSAVGSHDIVLGARFATRPGEPAEGERRLREITQWRREHQPGGTLNAGSVFKNPPEDAAGRLIDAVGLKGMRRGDVTVSERHANFFVAGPSATAQDVFDLVWAVRRAVGESTGVWLEPEIRFAGSFQENADAAAGPSDLVPGPGGSGV